MEKLFCLPKISIKEMEERVKEQRSTVKRYDFQTEYMQNRINHNSEIKITSPFYLKCEQKEKCECQFHRAKKQQIYNKKTYKSRLRIQDGNGLDRSIENGSPRKTKEKENEYGGGYRNSITAERIKNLSPIKLIEVLPSITPFREAPSNQSDLNLQSNLNKLPSHSSEKLPIKKINKSFAPKTLETQDFGEETGCKINDINLEFIKLISSRLQNEKYKQKYLKTLFGFIKYKINYDKTYLYHSRAYLQNSLNMLLNHYTMDKLLDSQQLKEEEVKEIAYYMNCLPSKVQGVLRDLAFAVSQMEGKLDEMKKAREDQAKEENKEDSSTILFNNIIKNHPNGTLVSLEDQINSINTRNSIMLDSLPIQAKTFPTQDSDANFMCKSQMQKHNIRKSNRQINELLSSSLSKKPRQSSKPIGESSKTRKSRNTSQIIPQLNKTLCSSVLGIVDECQQELLLKKKKSGGKPKKSQKKERLRLPSIDDKYAAVSFEKYINKKNFKSLIGEIERLDLNDSERASTIFKALNVQSQVQDQNRLNDILTTFKPLFNDKSLSHFIKEVILVKDRRYIQKLQRQLDSMLTEIKKNDPRIGGDLDYLQPRRRPQRQVHPLLGKIHLSNQYEKERKQPINHIIYYEAEERIQRHLTEQQSSKLHLEQAELKGLILFSIDPSISKLINHHNSPADPLKKYSSFSTLAPTDHKKVLGYMKRHHQGAFNYLSQQFRSLNSYLHSMHQ